MGRPTVVEDFIGTRYGRLLVIKNAGRAANGDALAEVKCDCGTVKVVSFHEVKRGGAKSCGCLHRERMANLNVKHREPRTYLYHAWQSMKARCSNENCSGFQCYGGRGISVCERWRDNFLNFKADVGERPSPLHSIDRIDNNGNYEPGNVKWSTVIEQSNNRRTNCYATINGERKRLNEWCAIYNVKYKCVQNRIYKGWEPEQAITTPFGLDNEQRKKR